MRNIRTQILETAYRQALKLLGPYKWAEHTNYLQQWHALYPEIAYTDTTDVGYPLSDDELTEIRAARQLQYVQLGTAAIKALHAEDLIPCLFVENGTDAFALNDPSGGNLMVLETMPVILRLVLSQPAIRPTDDVSVKLEKSNPIQTALFRDALDYLMNPHVFRGIKGATRGSDYPATVRDAMIVSMQNLEGLEAPMEAIDFRLEVIFDRQKERFQ